MSVTDAAQQCAAADATVAVGSASSSGCACGVAAELCRSAVGCKRFLVQGLGVETT